MTFRIKNYRQDRQRETLTLDGPEFVRRFLLHVLPRGFMRVRYYGLLANTQRAMLLARCRELLGVPTGTDSAAAAIERVEECPTDPEHGRCPACGVGWMQHVGSISQLYGCEQAVRLDLPATSHASAASATALPLPHDSS